MSMDVIEPRWPAPAGIRALSTTRHGGVSVGSWRSFNLGEHSGDNPQHVAANRERLMELLPRAPCWLEQVHGSDVASIDGDTDPTLGSFQKVDASVTSQAHVVLAVLTADCLPVLLCNTRGSRIGVAHAGWRGLAAGVVEAAVRAMGTSPSDVLAWLGPAIGGDAYEVGEDVRAEFARNYGQLLTGAFTPHNGGWKFDLQSAARVILKRLGVDRVFGGDWCTYSEPERFFSYRRDGVSGRMASCIWIDEAETENA